MEPLVALGIISMILLIATLVFSNLSKGNKGFLITLAKNEITTLRIQDELEDEVYEYETFKIEKSVSPYRSSKDLLEIEWQVYDFENTMIYEFKEVTLRHD
jgi:hypothetical protein